MMTTLKSTAVILLIFSSSHLCAQQWNFGGKFGLNYSSGMGNGFSSSYNLGYSGGVWATYAITKKFKFQPELEAAQYNYKKGDDFDKYYKNDVGRVGADSKIRLAYLNVPLLMRYEIIPLVSVMAGPQVGVVFFEDENLRKDGDNAFKRAEFSVNAGAQVNLGTFGVWGRFNQGISNISNVSTKYNWNSQHVSFGVSLRIK
ncbi:MAG: porin family protein [Agriterribacter sp.]